MWTIFVPDDRSGARAVTVPNNGNTIKFSDSSHTRTVVRECFKGDEASQWKRPKFDLSPHQNP